MLVKNRSRSINKKNVDAMDIDNLNKGGKDGKGKKGGKEGKGKDAEGKPLGCLRLAGSGTCSFEANCYYSHDDAAIAKSKDYVKKREERNAALTAAGKAPPAKPKGGSVAVRMALTNIPWYVDMAMPSASATRPCFARSCLQSRNEFGRPIQVQLQTVSFDDNVQIQDIEENWLHTPYTGPRGVITGTVQIATKVSR